MQALQQEQQQKRLQRQKRYKREDFHLLSIIEPVKHLPEFFSQIVRFIKKNPEDFKRFMLENDLYRYEDFLRFACDIDSLDRDDLALILDTYHQMFVSIS